MIFTVINWTANRVEDFNVQNLCSSLNGLEPKILLIFTHNALLYSQKDRILFSNVASQHKNEQYLPIWANLYNIKNWSQYLNLIHT